MIYWCAFVFLTLNFCRMEVTFFLQSSELQVDVRQQHTHTIHENEFDLLQPTCWWHSSGTAAATESLDSHTPLCLSWAWHWSLKGKEFSVMASMPQLKMKGWVTQTCDIRCLDTLLWNRLNYHCLLDLTHRHLLHGGDQSLFYHPSDAATAAAHVHLGSSQIS